MLKQYHHIAGGVFRAVDAAVIGIAWIVAYPLRFYFPLIAVSKGFPPFAQYAALCPLVICVWILVLSSMRVYRSRRMLRRTQEVQLLIKSHGFSLLVLIALTYLFSEYRYSRAVMVYFALLGGVGLVVFRLLLRNALRALRQRGIYTRSVVIIGEGAVAEKLLHKLGKFPELGFRCSGHLKLADVPQLSVHLDQLQPSAILIALPRKATEELEKILRTLKDYTAEIKIVPDLQDFVPLGCEVEDFDGLPIVHMNDSPLAGWGAWAKRATDILLSSLALLLFSPLLALIGVLIKLTSRGPVLYRQERMGLDGHTFQILKFRSMQIDAEKKSGAVWAQPNDQRRTAIGAFLRSTSLDELPQLWNVLKGDMSLVGPRPERPIFVNQFRKDIPFYMLRHKVKAGITGWAQVHGWRGNTSIGHRIEFDLFYIRNWSYLLDLKIMLLTLWRGFMNKNAY